MADVIAVGVSDRIGVMYLGRMMELADSDESYKYINYLVVKEGNEESTKTKALIAALQNDDVKKYIEEKYSGSVIPAF